MKPAAISFWSGRRWPAVCAATAALVFVIYQGANTQLDGTKPAQITAEPQISKNPQVAIQPALPHGPEVTGLDTPHIHVAMATIDKYQRKHLPRKPLGDFYVSKDVMKSIVDVASKKNEEITIQVQDENKLEAAFGKVIDHASLGHAVIYIDSSAKEAIKETHSHSLHFRIYDLTLPDTSGLNKKLIPHARRASLFYNQ